jgi:S-adenosylmethionine:tRNA ribosyltransferase-isomerase
MKAATAPRGRPSAARLLAVDVARGTFQDAFLEDLPSLLRRGDLLVVNDAATLPASLSGTLGGRPIELRLAAARDDGAFDAVLFGAGDWRTRTENRPPPPPFAEGSVIQLSGLCATIAVITSGRALRVRFDLSGDALVEALWGAGRPIQYAHLAADLSPWDVQTPWATRPWSMELPSAAFPFTFRLIAALKARGVALAPLTHGCGLSSTGDARIDSALPWPERYEIPPSTADAVRAATSRGGRVVALGTSVTRALESAADGTGVQAGSGTATLRISPAYRLRVVDSLISGLHDPSESHFALIGAFAPPPLLERAWAHAESNGYLGHEYGDLCLLGRG